MLEVKDATSGYGRMMIVHDIDLDVDDEIALIIGPNGSGKSTLLKTIFGLIKPINGRIIYNGEDITGLKPNEIVRLGMGYVPQLNNVFPSLTVMENLEMGAYIKDRSDDGLEDAFNIFPMLKEKNREKAKNLSGGERQMLAVARALMTGPRLLLLDEPSASLSPKLVDRLIQKIKEIRKLETSILLVEQNAEKSLQIADKTCVMVMGRKVYEGHLINDEEIARLYLGKK
jgi:ABC-type branched-subunit amino acid transport system ATPase component